ncbi:MAG: hypothetical protein DRQ55_09240 [Planctomycetota bacterium]|nr:MAG: hypothetical protein DRQ55_09240 [Planctomycetota bacterium]
MLGGGVAWSVGVLNWVLMRQLFAEMWALHFKNYPSLDLVVPVMLSALLFVAGAVSIARGMCLTRLRVRDAGDCLEVCFGPLPLWRRSVSYADIIRAKPKRLGWWELWFGGKDFRWGRGSEWRLAGPDIVELTLTDGRLRVGTNDQDGLLEFLEQRIGSRAAG